MLGFETPEEREARLYLEGREEKQSYLIAEIANKGYDPSDFAQFIEYKKGKISVFIIYNIKLIFIQFIFCFQKEEQILITGHFKSYKPWSRNTKEMLMIKLSLIRFQVNMKIIKMKIVQYDILFRPNLIYSYQKRPDNEDQKHEEEEKHQDDLKFIDVQSDIDSGKLFVNSGR